MGPSVKLVHWLIYLGPTVKAVKLAHGPILQLALFVEWPVGNLQLGPTVEVAQWPIYSWGQL